ncbi:MAG: signal peptidase II [Actinobacteria bacterium]|nr:signal peptidase II [Actinomycetota bacterium]MBU1492910.1 signal peptidase II [Actinomycetota bacterium]
MRRITLTPRIVALIVAGAVVVLDQATKWMAVRALADGPIPLIDGLLQFKLVENSGSAFSLFQGGGAVIALIAIAAVAMIVVIVHQLPSRLEALAIGLVLGGAVGNLLDRIFRGDGFLTGKVIDFIDFEFFWTFNVADSAITIGAIMAVLLAFRKR